VSIVLSRNKTDGGGFHAGMGAGMLPIAIGLGTDPSFRAPMAIVVIGGLITSTFLSLLVIPVVFTYVDDAINALARYPFKFKG